MEIYIKRKVVDDRYGIFPGMSLLLSPFAKILTIGLVAALLGSAIFSVFKVLEIKDLQIELAKEQTKTTLLDSQLATCNGEIEDQNLKLKEIRAEAEQDVTAVKEVNDKLTELSKKQRNEINVLRNRPAPENCDDSKAWLRENLDIFGEKK